MNKIYKQKMKLIYINKYKNNILMKINLMNHNKIHKFKKISINKKINR